MKIICTKEEFAEMLSHCVSNVNGTDCRACNKCVLYEKCEGAYVDTLTRYIEVKDDAAD